METFGDLQRPVVAHGDQWRLMETFRDLWRPMETYRDLRELLFFPSLLFFHLSLMLCQGLSDIFHHSIQKPLCKHNLPHQTSNILYTNLLFSSLCLVMSTVEPTEEGTTQPKRNKETTRSTTDCLQWAIGEAC